MTNIRLDEPAFRRKFPELDTPGLSLPFIKLQWNIAGQYIGWRLDVFGVPTQNTYDKMVAHLIKLNVLAQAGKNVTVSAPRQRAAFIPWLQQTSYGASIG